MLQAVHAHKGVNLQVCRQEDFLGCPIHVCVVGRIRFAEFVTTHSLKPTPYPVRGGCLPVTVRIFQTCTPRLPNSYFA